MVQDVATVARYTIEEVAKHNGKIEKTHPGGRDMLEEVAGKDATTKFLDMGHSSDAKSHLKTLKIGEIVENQKKDKRKQNVESNNKPNRSFVSLVTCGLVG
ncbi:unnamed protein product [Callosobruchus maculatus]|uniref:Cytochrome b5 heme-binding domain-containing protein n=1 Tax=Callosobruchus maculatus TaxID=64391 RepID=A0A653BZU2_CALMS|nr:unnamed protein product [Callosobruchus maculatus]